MCLTRRKEEEVESDGYRFVRFYDEEKIIEKQDYRPDSTLIDRVVYEWDESVSARLPARWKVYDQNGNLQSSTEHEGWNEAGTPEFGVMYDAEGNETSRVKLKK